jgi:phosphoglycerate dehydrogenase-like enzyme
VSQPVIPQKLNVGVAARVSAEYLDQIRAVDPGRIELTYLQPHLIDLLKGEWPERTVNRFLGGMTPEPLPAEDLEALLGAQHVLLLGNPFPKRIVGRMPELLWGHFNFAGVSNLMGSDWYGAEGPMITSSRGYISPRPIAESVIAATMLFARRLDLAARNTKPGFDMSLDPPGVLNVFGKTMGIIGLGGIGREVAVMAKGLGMRVVATRGTATEVRHDDDGVDTVYPPSHLHEALAESDFIAVCAMWTPQTEGMLDEAAFAATKPGAYFINIARDGLVVEPALIAALESGHLAGAYLDVWANDRTSPPADALLNHPNVVCTPHISHRGDVAQNLGLTVFLDNLARLLEGEPLENVIDWNRGY